ncbi:MAG: diacylglycerol kinase family protein [Candidatus Delongbacteria bacterium]|jgi:diacylglycerol kinase family enzyme|nr:diacylglycerol kinase family protein [Candidatus Delongbacteria bacterium]MDD4204692.1 diacylglycerol kinase family protein [Candidatus Delongbacteria bacterium]MDY0017571.1 diacylglycerol kinase family protein [Candidatus Delongbacteria bacterium]
MLYIVINKYSGGYSQRRIFYLEKSVEKEFPEFTIRETVLDKHRVSADINPMEIKKGDIIVAAGGDGTINACLQFIHDNSLQEQILLGVIPLGTGNNMIGSLKLPRTIESAVNVLKKRRFEQISYSSINGSKVFFNCSIGFSSFVLKNRKTSSLAGYFYETARLLPLYKSCKIKFAEKENCLDLFAGFFINTKVYMSKFKFLKANNSGNMMKFFYIEGANFITGLTDTLKAFTGIKEYKTMERNGFKFDLPENHYIELDGDIFEIGENNRTITLENCSTVKIITNGDI